MIGTPGTKSKDRPQNSAIPSVCDQIIYESASSQKFRDIIPAEDRDKIVGVLIPQNRQERRRHHYVADPVRSEYEEFLTP